MRKMRMMSAGLAVALSIMQVAPVYADAISELKQQKSATESQLSQVNSAIASLESQKAEILGQIDTMGQELAVTMASINTLTTQIDDKQEDITQTTSDLNAARKQENTEYEAMKKRIQYLYENGGDVSWSNMLFAQEDLSTLLSKAENTQKMYKYDRECLTQYAETVQQVSELKEQQEIEKAEFETMKNEQEEQKGDLEVLIDEAKAASVDYGKQIAQAEAVASEYQAVIAEQNEQIEILVEQQRAAEEAARKAAEEEARKEAERQAAAEEEAARQAAIEEAEAQQAAAAEQDVEAEAAELDEESYDDSEDVSYDDSSSDYDSDDTDYEAYDDEEDDDSYYEEEEEEEDYTPSSSGSATGQAIVDYATQFVGNPYVWGGNSLTNGIDCSGFVNQVYAHFGYSVARQSAALRSAGYGVSYSEAQPGDIICYSGHVAIYMGNGAIVHAADERSGIKISYNAAYQPILAVRRVV
ncbi:MAG TPA: hydrolase [Lachnospiraceae bacterium]|nr:hydrolase [Lachnospiraceae bacterium]